MRYDRLVTFPSFHWHVKDAGVHAQHDHVQATSHAWEKAPCAGELCAIHINSISISLNRSLQLAHRANLSLRATSQKFISLSRRTGHELEDEPIVQAEQIWVPTPLQPSIRLRHGSGYFLATLLTLQPHYWTHQPNETRLILVPLESRRHTWKFLHRRDSVDLNINAMVAKREGAKCASGRERLR